MLHSFKSTYAIPFDVSYVSVFIPCLDRGPVSFAIIKRSIRTKTLNVLCYNTFNVARSKKKENTSLRFLYIDFYRPK